MTRGLERVKTEFNLACIATNLKKIEKFLEENDSKTPFLKRSKRRSSKMGIKTLLQWYPA